MAKCDAGSGVCGFYVQTMQHPLSLKAGGGVQHMVGPPTLLGKPSGIAHFFGGKKLVVAHVVWVRSFGCTLAC